MKRKNVWLLLSSLVVLSLVLASCAPTTPAAPTIPTAPAAPGAPTTPTAPAAPTVPTATAAEVPKYGGTLTIAPIDPFGSGWDTVLQAQPGNYPAAQVMQNLLEGDWTKGAVGTNEHDFLTSAALLLLMRGELAESWETPDDETLIYHIRRGVRWGLNPNFEASRLVGGRELTADDVAFTIDRKYNTPKAYYQTRTDPMERPVSVTATDKYTVELKSNPGFLGVMFQRVNVCFIFAPEIIGKYGNMLDWRTMVGTGPFMVSDHVPGSSATFVRNPSYWETDPIGPGKGNRLPYIDTVKILDIADKSTRLAAFRTAKIDHLGGRGQGVVFEDVQMLERTVPDMRVLAGPPGETNGLAFRLDIPELPTSDIRVRQAISMAIDRETILQQYFEGAGVFKVFPAAPFRWMVTMKVYRPLEEYSEVVQGYYRYDPEKARQLLAEAGYPKGFKMQVIVEAAKTDELSLIKEYLAKIGVTVDLSVKERTVFTSLSSARTYPEVRYGSVSTSAPWAFHPVRAGHTNNHSNVNDPVINQAIKEFDKYMYLDDNKAYEIWRQAWDYAEEQLWYVDIPSPSEYTVWHPWLKNYHGEFLSGTSPRFFWSRYSWLDQELKKSTGF